MSLQISLYKCEWRKSMFKKIFEIKLWISVILCVCIVSRELKRMMNKIYTPSYKNKYSETINLVTEF